MNVYTFEQQYFLNIESVQLVDVHHNSVWSFPNKLLLHVLGNDRTPFCAVNEHFGATVWPDMKSNLINLVLKFNNP